MIKDNVQDALRTGYWAEMCGNVQSDAQTHPPRSARARALLQQVITRFFELPAPATDQELADRRMQRSGLMSMMQLIHQADALVSQRPGAEEKVFKETENFCAQGFPSTQERLGALHAQATACAGKLEMMAL
jgi:hypothetical protein